MVLRRGTRKARLNDQNYPLLFKKPTDLDQKYNKIFKNNYLLLLTPLWGWPISLALDPRCAVLSLHSYRSHTWFRILALSSDRSLAIGRFYGMRILLSFKLRYFRPILRRSESSCQKSETLYFH